jgi:hypothetical protein
MYTERDKFLTEAMGECWHEWEGHHSDYKCCMHCGKDGGYPEGYRIRLRNSDFSTWEGFGKLWEWSQKQEWWFRFWYYSSAFDHSGVEVAFPRDACIIKPDRFASIIYRFLKEK